LDPAGEALPGGCISGENPYQLHKDKKTAGPERCPMHFELNTSNTKTMVIDCSLRAVMGGSWIASSGDAL
jgi:hypothetical protein